MLSFDLFTLLGDMGVARKTLKKGTDHPRISIIQENLLHNILKAWLAHWRCKLSLSNLLLRYVLRVRLLYKTIKWPTFHRTTPRALEVPLWEIYFCKSTYCTGEILAGGNEL